MECDDVPLLPNVSIHQFHLDDHVQLVQHRLLFCSFLSLLNLMWQQVNSFLRQQFNSSRGSHIKDCWLI